MRVCTSRFLVPFALGVMGFGVLFLSGCGEGSPKSAEAVSPTSSEATPVKSETLAKLEKLRHERTALVTTREKIVAEMKAMVDAKRAAMKGANDAAVKAALEKDAAWVSLYNRCQDLNAAIGEKRQAAAAEVRTALAPNKKISK